jgi:hypothetical protein
MSIGVSIDDVNIESKLITYAKEFLSSYTDTVYTNFLGFGLVCHHSSTFPP